jgi:hypothetical protein
MKNYMLKMMDMNMVKKFMAAMKKEVITPGSTIVSQGHRGDKYCVIITGLVDAFAYKLGSQVGAHIPLELTDIIIILNMLILVNKYCVGGKLYGGKSLV